MLHILPSQLTPFVLMQQIVVDVHFVVAEGPQTAPAPLPLQQYGDPEVQRFWLTGCVEGQLGLCGGRSGLFARGARRSLKGLMCAIGSGTGAGAGIGSATGIAVAMLTLTQTDVKTRRDLIWESIMMLMLQISWQFPKEAKDLGENYLDDNG
ncbi:hypothetical protein BGZ60DRAFT_416883 [Tricladium varicosporioides]|nr:hypothetical protein BGZ60DRAFT_416883 [Hymenoscyphus varicosporioides]